MTPETFGLSVPQGWEWAATRRGLSFTQIADHVIVEVVKTGGLRAWVQITAWLPADQPRGDFFRLDGREVPAARVAGEVQRLAARAAGMGIPGVGGWLSAESK